MPKIILRQTTPEPATAIVQDQDGNELARQDIASGATGIIPVNTGSGVLYTYPYDSFNTGQNVRYAIGDDKDIRDTVFAPEIAAQEASGLLLVYPRLSQTDPTKLVWGSNPDGSGTNIFGNLERFTDELGTQNYANDLVIDHLTGLMYKRTIESAKIWDNSISAADSSVFGNKNDWFVPNQIISVTLGNNAQNNGSLNFSPFNINTVDLLLWTSTATNDIVRAKTYQTYNSGLNSNAILAARLINDIYNYLITRKAFTYNPTTKQMDLI